MKYVTLLLIFFSLRVCGQMTVAPAQVQKQPIVLMHGQVHVGSGQVIEDGAVAFDKGKIIFVGAATGFIRDAQDWKVIDCHNQLIYPGLIACNNVVGLSEFELVRATRDFYEVGECNSNVRSVIAYNTDSKIIPTVRSNGILLTEATPQGGVISGSSSIMMTDGWNWEDAAYKTDVGLHLNWPTTQATEYKNGQWSIKANEEYLKQIAAISDFFNNAQTYLTSPQPSYVNTRLEAMKGIFDGKRKVFIHADGAKEISAAIAFASLFNLKMVIVGGRDSWMVTDILKNNNIPVILGRTHSLPGLAESDIDQPYKTAKILQDAGVLYALSVPESWQVRNLPFMAGTAAAYGLTKEQALESITLNAATIMGINDRCGTLEIGKDAFIFVSQGDMLDMISNKITYAFIQGRNIDLYNFQEKLYDIYKAKYSIDK